jgi:hypothetical protein
MHVIVIFCVFLHFGHSNSIYFLLISFKNKSLILNNNTSPHTLLSFVLSLSFSFSLSRLNDSSLDFSSTTLISSKLEQQYE